LALGDANRGRVPLNQFETASERGMSVDEQSDVDIEYVSEALDAKAPGLEAFSDVFARFQAPEGSSEEVRRSHPHIMLVLAKNYC
jgi:hypothetical protein